MLCLDAYLPLPGPALWHTRAVRGENSQIRTKSALFPSHSGRNDCVGQCGRMNHAMCPVHIKPMLFVSGHTEVPGESCQSGGTGRAGTELVGTTGQLESYAGFCIHPG